MKPVGRGFDPHQELLASVAQLEEQLPQMYNLLNLVLDFFVQLGYYMCIEFEIDCSAKTSVSKETSSSPTYNWLQWSFDGAPL
jgi:hypothetical protein